MRPFTSSTSELRSVMPSLAASAAAAAVVVQARQATGLTQDQLARLRWNFSQLDQRHRTRKPGPRIEDLLKILAARTPRRAVPAMTPCESLPTRSAKQ